MLRLRVGIVGVMWTGFRVQDATDCAAPGRRQKCQCPRSCLQNTTGTPSPFGPLVCGVSLLDELVCTCFYNKIRDLA